MVRIPPIYICLADTENAVGLNRTRGELKIEICLTENSLVVSKEQHCKRIAYHQGDIEPSPGQTEMVLDAAINGHCDLGGGMTWR